MASHGDSPLPVLSLLITLAVVAVTTWRATRAASLGRRVLLGAVLLTTAVPLLVVELSWSQLLDDAVARFERPTLAPLVTVAVALVALRWLAPGPGPGPQRRVLSGLLAWASAMTCALVVLGLSSDAPPVDRQVAVLVVDRSRSMDLVPDAPARIAREMASAEPSMRAEDRLGLVALGADAALEMEPRWHHGTRPPPVVVDRDATDLAAGIRRALTAVPDDAAGRIVLLTDGDATRGDTVAAAAEARMAGVRVDAVELTPPDRADVRVRSLEAPPTLAAGESFELRALIVAPAPVEVDVEIERDGTTVHTSRTRLETGEQVVRLRQVAPREGSHRYEIRIKALAPALDAVAANNHAVALVRVRGASTALVLEGDEGRGEFVAGSLRTAGFHVEVGDGAAVPEGVAGMAGYDLIVLSDIPASALSTAQTHALASYTRDLGGGLLLLAGDRSLGAGGYRDTPVEEVSPVRFEPPPERRPSRSLVLALDTSGSMIDPTPAGPTKITLASEAVARAIAQLGPADQVGVALVDTQVRWSTPLGPVSAMAYRGGPGAEARGGGILVDVALDASYAALRSSSDEIRHVILFSDGDDAEQIGGCRERVAAALAAGITTSVVALGQGKHVEALAALAAAGGGRFHLVDLAHADRLPAVFAEEAGRLGDSSLRDISFRPVAATPGVSLRGVDVASAPPLGGYAVTTPRARAAIHLTGPGGDPLLAVWSVGLGRAAAFMSDLKDRWGLAWTSWPGAARLVGQLGRELARRLDDPRLRLEGEVQGRTLRVRATVTGARAPSDPWRRLTVTIAAPDGTTTTRPLEPVGLGSYAAEAPALATGAYLVTAVDESSHQPVGTCALWAADDELRQASGHDLLVQVTSLTGGRLRTTLAGLFDERLARRGSPTPLAPTLLPLAALLLVASVASRRLVVQGTKRR